MRTVSKVSENEWKYRTRKIVKRAPGKFDIYYLTNKNRVHSTVSSLKEAQFRIDTSIERLNDSQSFNKIPKN